VDQIPTLDRRAASAPPAQMRIKFQLLYYVALLRPERPISGYKKNIGSVIVAYENAASIRSTLCDAWAM